ncbi:hypothetical protein D3874_00340 [Oleomonas cavernae]|uniref:Alcohol dehydrogenase-like N-terminal domain-containing protein n=1 Tax=Oleomonas cavernae TaxID=2320859 RepID=A0A418WSW2_9PROT|nr:alcohol dehydrogenase catalytic domain-containing protein [Oleomonas cavernae]RJF94341.1 hypothetical protein D3874_00340 [Oleomonas cavernae]
MKRQKMVEYGAPLCEVVEPDPVPQGSEVLVRVTRCGVCHSDVHIHEGFFDLGGGNRADIRANRKLPFTLGHEIVGTVVATGPAAEGVAVGDARVVYPWIGCGACPTCARGWNTCAPRAGTWASTSKAALAIRCWCRTRAMCWITPGSTRIAPGRWPARA